MAPLAIPRGYLDIVRPSFCIRLCTSGCPVPLPTSHLSHVLTVNFKAYLMFANQARTQPRQNSNRGFLRSVHILPHAPERSLQLHPKYPFIFGFAFESQRPQSLSAAASATVV